MPAAQPLTAIADNIAKVRARIQQAQQENGRDADCVRLLAVSKTRNADDIRAAFDAGVRDFGENYLQEAEVKIAALADLPLTWHFIGPVQSNKTRQIAALFDWVLTVDRPKTAERLNAQRPDHLPPLNVCLQVNIDRSPTKSGTDPETVAALATRVASLPRLRLRGLMAIPDPAADPNQLKCLFGEMSSLLNQLRRQFPGNASLDTLSLGMSADLETAIACGSTQVRVGTDIFGVRT